MPEIYNVLTNPNLQAFVFSPLMGIVFALLFSGLSKPSQPATTLTVRETRKVYIERYHYHRSSQRNNEDGATFGAAALLMMLVIWQYSLHALEIQHILITVLTTALYFSVVSALIAFWKGHITSSGWVACLAAPMIALSVGLVLALRAQSGFPSEVIESANQYKFLQFYLHGLSHYGRYYLMTHVIGVVGLFLLAMLVIFTTLLLEGYVTRWLMP